MYILILFQFSTCVLAGIGFNHFLKKIKNRDINFHKEALFKILIITIALIGSIFLFRGSLTDFSNKWEEGHKQNIQHVVELRQEGQESEADYLFNQIKLDIEEKVKKFAPTQSSIRNLDVLVSIVILLLLYCIIQ